MERGLSELSIFIDESGNLDQACRYYLVTLVFHEQNDEYSEPLERFKWEIAEARLPEHPFHLGPLLRANRPFDSMDIATRKRILSRFSALTTRLPFRYLTFWTRTSEVDHDEKWLADRMVKELYSAMITHLDYFQRFSHVKVYYDNGQGFVTRAVHSALETALSRNAIIHKDASPKDYVFAQVADYVCGLELAALKYERKEQGGSEVTFFGDKGSFRKNYLKKLRKRLMD